MSDELREKVALLLAQQEIRGPATYEQFHERAGEVLALLFAAPHDESKEGE